MQQQPGNFNWMGKSCRLFTNFAFHLWKNRVQPSVHFRVSSSGRVGVAVVVLGAMRPSDSMPKMGMPVGVQRLRPL